MIINPYALGSKAHRYWRLLFTGLPAGAVRVALDEIEFWDRPGARRFVTGSYFASGVLGASNVVAYAVDQQLLAVGGVGMWASQDAGLQWFAIDAGFGFGFELAAVALCRGNYLLGVNAPPTSFDVQWSDDAINWTTLWSETGIPEGWDYLDVRTFYNPFYTGVATLVFPPAGTPQHWLDAGAGVYKDAGVTLAMDGDTIQQITNFGTDVAFAQATAGARPTFKTGGLNGRPYVLNAASKFLNDIAMTSFAGSGIAPTYTIFAIMQNVDLSSPSALIGFGTAGKLTTYFRSAANQILFAKGQFAFGTVPDPFMWSWWLQDGGNLVYYLNRVFGRKIDGNNFPFAGATTQQFLRDTSQPGSGYFKGRLYEFIAYPTNLNPLLINRIDKYLKAKYGV